MDMQRKAKYYANIVSQMRKAIGHTLAKQRLEEALTLIDSCAEVEYDSNQCYTDKQLENCLTQIASALLPVPTVTNWDKKRILFYDGFGFNSRGLVQIYLKGLCKLGHVIYVADQAKQNDLPDVLTILQDGNADVVWLGAQTYTERIRQLYDLVLEHRPGSAFLYTTPNDVVGLCVFEKLAGMCKRYQINLTDHAFWLGRNAFDYCIEFRDYGASVSRFYRDIPQEKLVKLPFYPVFDTTRDFEGFPFDASGKKVVFSGGSLYKTLGGDNLYYETVRHILDTYPDAVFWYAGGGNSTELDKLIAAYPDRVFHTLERRDLYQVLKHCFFYLSTYPITGGLMFQYAAVAGKLPVTLRYDSECDGYLLDQENLGIQFDTMDGLKAELHRLFTDDTYRTEKEDRVQNAVVNQAEFDGQLANILQTQSSIYPIVYAPPDTAGLIAEYLEALDPNHIRDQLSRKRNLPFARYLPADFLLGLILKVKKKLVK